MQLKQDIGQYDSEFFFFLEYCFFRDARYIGHISISADFFLLSGDIFKLINNALFPSETLQMCAVHHDGFEMLEIWLESLWKWQYTYVWPVQSKSVIKATYNYNKNITVNYVVEYLFAVFCACAERIHNGATPP